MSRSLSVIASEIRKSWKNPQFSAEPYLRAMSEMDDIQQNYYMDSGKTIVRYFLSNASSWRGPDAKRIKQELKELLK